MIGFILERTSVQTESQTDGLTDFQTVRETFIEIETLTGGEDRNTSRSTRRGIDECVFGSDLTALMPVTAMVIRTFILYCKGKRVYP
jgi:hypothetical protein